MQRSSTAEPLLPRNTPAVEQGESDYRAGLRKSDNPFKAGKQRRDWYTGWYDAYYRERLAHIWNRWNLTY